MRSLVILSAAAGVLAGLALGEARRRARQRDMPRAQPEALQVWEDEGGAVPTRAGRNAREVSPSGRASVASSMPRDAMRSSLPPDDFPPVPSPS